MMFPEIPAQVLCKYDNSLSITPDVLACYPDYYAFQFEYITGENLEAISIFKKQHRFEFGPKYITYLNTDISIAGYIKQLTVGSCVCSNIFIYLI